MLFKVRVALTFKLKIPYKIFQNYFKYTLKKFLMGYTVLGDLKCKFRNYP